MIKSAMIASSFFAATGYARELQGMEPFSENDCYNVGEMYSVTLPPIEVDLFRPIEYQVMEIEMWYGDAFDEKREECGPGEYHIWCRGVSEDIYKVDYRDGTVHLELSMDNLNDGKYPD